MPEIENRLGAVSIEVVLAEFDHKAKHFSDLCITTKSLVERILNEKEIAIHSVQARVKDREKLGRKYSSADKEYRNLGEMPDIVGFRIITYYADQIDKVKNIILEEFTMLGQPDDKRIAGAREFGYSALHIDCNYLQARLERTEYKRFQGARFEIQITTVLGHAWAEIHHGWYDAKPTPPQDDERRFFRLAAVLELADQEFVRIRQDRDNRQKLTSIRSDAELPLADELAISLLNVQVDFEAPTDELPPK